jgi:transposase-like protein
MALTQIRCADCGGKNVEGYRTSTIKDGKHRTMYHYASCGCSFSETKQPPLAHLKTPLSVIVQVLSALTEGVGINAATRLYGVSKNSI